MMSILERSIVNTMEFSDLLFVRRRQQDETATQTRDTQYERRVGDDRRIAGRLISRRTFVGLLLTTVAAWLGACGPTPKPTRDFPQAAAQVPCRHAAATDEHSLPSLLPDLGVPPPRLTHRLFCRHTRRASPPIPRYRRPPKPAAATATPYLPWTWDADGPLAAILQPCGPVRHST